jgi:multicomponent Na+:H+ antiporter subunit G
VIHGLADAILAGLLGLVVLAAWLGSLALLRLPHALNRLHAVTFVNIACGVLVSVIGFVADGVSGRSLKIMVAMIILVLAGAVQSHASGRALFFRDGRTS